MNRYRLDPESATRTAVARTLVGTAFVAGFAALVWAHG